MIHTVQCSVYDMSYAPLHKIACAKKIKSVGIRPRCVRVNHTLTYLKLYTFGN